MLKKVNILFILITLLITLTSCSIDTTTNVIAPDNKVSPMEGKWEEIKCYNKNLVEEKIDAESSNMQFTKHAAVIGKNIYANPLYNVKKVNSDDYFTNKLYDIQSKQLGIVEKEINIITVTSSQNYINEFAKIGQNELLCLVKDQILIYKKSGSKADDEFNKSIGSNFQFESNNNYVNDSVKSGVLLGIKVADSSKKSFYYKTYWISAEDRKIHSILEMNRIFLPRKNGFWSIDNNYVGEGRLTVTNLSNNIIARQISRGNNMNILFISNDYASVEINFGNRSYFRLIPIDNINNENGMRISDVLGENSSVSLNSSRNAAIKEMDPSMKVIDNNDEYENFSLYRKTGHWFIQGRIDYTKDNAAAYMDYGINVIPSNKLLMYDSLCVPWSSIKDKVPDAVDAFTSPNKDIAVIVCKGKIEIYSIIKGKLSDNPITNNLIIDDGTSVVMAEWCEDQYTDVWEKNFLKYK